jgi:phosphoribosylglycinamide formyltransferase-1
MSKIRIALFASGQGSNALNIIAHFQGHPDIEVAFVLSNKADAPVLLSAEALGVTGLHYDNDQVGDGIFLTEVCRNQQIDIIVLAGYLRLVPAELIRSYPEHIFNIHPALLPKFGGAGMYGNFVHAAIREAGESETGITIHYVDEAFDSGRILAQMYCRVEAADGLEEIRQKVQALEHAYYPVTIEKTILNHRHV